MNHKTYTVCRNRFETADIENYIAENIFLEGEPKIFFAKDFTEAKEIYNEQIKTIPTPQTFKHNGKTYLTGEFVWLEECSVDNANGYESTDIIDYCFRSLGTSLNEYETED